jgi:hypothetical protein
MTAAAAACKVPAQLQMHLHMIIDILHQWLTSCCLGGVQPHLIYQLQSCQEWELLEANHLQAQTVAG